MGGRPRPSPGCGHPRRSGTAAGSGFDAAEVAAIHEFLLRGTDYIYRRAAALRAQKISQPGTSAAVLPSVSER